MDSRTNLKVGTLHLACRSGCPWSHPRSLSTHEHHPEIFHEQEKHLASASQSLKLASTHRRENKCGLMHKVMATESNHAMVLITKHACQNAPSRRSPLSSSSNGTLNDSEAEELDLCLGVNAMLSNPMENKQTTRDYNCIAPTVN